jgi:hypothetical protein
LTTVAHGRLTGELTLGGRGVRGVGDLFGRFDARLGTTQAAAIPGLVEADRLLGVLSLAGTPFKQGRLRGVIGSGAATIDELSLSGDRVAFWSEGKVRLDNRRVDLDVVISTGSFDNNNQQLLAFAAQLALQSAFPVTALVELNRLLSNRTVYLDFLGTLADPRVRIKPLEILREEAARFLVRELLVAASLANAD